MKSDNEKKVDLIKAMKEYSLILMDNPDERTKFIQATGMYTKTGRLKRCYR